MRGKIALICGLFCALPLLADTIVLRDGSVLRGRVTGQDPSAVAIEVEGKEILVAKSRIRMFRLDEDGLEFYRKRIKEEEQARETRSAEVARTLESFAFPDGLLVQLAAGQGRHHTALKNVIVDDRVKDNAMTRGNPAAYTANFSEGLDKGVEGSIQLRRSRWFVEIGGASYTTKLNYETYGLPVVSSLMVPTAASINQIGFITISPIQKQDAYGIIAFEPYTFGAPFRWYLFAGASGAHHRARAEGPISVSLQLGNFLTTSSVYVDNFESVGSNAGHRLGLDLRFRFQGGTEIQLRGWASEMKGWTRGRGILLSSSEYANFVQDGRNRIRAYALQTTLYFPLASRFRLLTGFYAEDYKQTLSHRTDLQFPSYANISNVDFRKNLLRLYDKPAHSGRVHRFFAGTEFRI